MKKQTGVTLIELLVTVSLLAIVTAWGAPSFNRLMAQVRVDSDINKIRGTFSYARSEAITNQVPITICASSTGTDCTTGADWSQGWIVFKDVDNNQVLDSPVTGNCGARDECILKVIESSQTQTELLEASGHTNITFDREGKVDPNSNRITLALKMKQNCGVGELRNISVSRFGRLAITKGDC